MRRYPTGEITDDIYCSIYQTIKASKAEEMTS